MSTLAQERFIESIRDIDPELTDMGFSIFAPFDNQKRICNIY
jgi:hypothetical protein